MLRPLTEAERNHRVGVIQIGILQTRHRPQKGRCLVCENLHESVYILQMLHIYETFYMFADINLKQLRKSRGFTQEQLGIISAKSKLREEFKQSISKELIYV